MFFSSEVRLFYSVVFSIYESDGPAICDSDSDEAAVTVKLFVVLE